MQSSKDLLSEVFLKIKEKGDIDDEFVKYLDSIYPDKSSEILQVLKRGITKYSFKPSNRIIWTAIGENDEYLIYPKIYCGCIDFYNRVVIKRKKVVCKHLIAQTIAAALNNFKEEELDDEKYTALIKELELKE